MDKRKIEIICYQMKNKEKIQIKEIIINATIIYTDDIKEFFEVIRIINDGVIIGRIINNKFCNCGFISKRNIKEIKHGIKKKIVIIKL